MVPDEGVRMMESPTTTTTNTTTSTAIIDSSSQQKETAGQQEGTDNNTTADGSPRLSPPTDITIEPADMKAPTTLNPDTLPDANTYTNSNIGTNSIANNVVNNVVNNNSNNSNSSNGDSQNVLLRIPRAKTPANSSDDSYSNLTKSVQNGPDNILDEINVENDNQLNTPSVWNDTKLVEARDSETEPASGETGESKAPSRRASYIDVVGLSSDELQTCPISGDNSTADGDIASTNGVASPALRAATATPKVIDESEDKDFSEDEDKLVIHEGSTDRRADAGDIKQEDDKVVTIGEFCVTRWLR